MGVNSSAVEAFTEGNILFRSLKLAPLKPSFNQQRGGLRRGPCAPIGRRGGSAVPQVERELRDPAL